MDDTVATAQSQRSEKNKKMSSRPSDDSKKSRLMLFFRSLFQRPRSFCDSHLSCVNNSSSHTPLICAFGTSALKIQSLEKKRFRTPLKLDAIPVIPPAMLPTAVVHLRLILRAAQCITSAQRVRKLSSTTVSPRETCGLKHTFTKSTIFTHC